MSDRDAGTWRTGAPVGGQRAMRDQMRARVAAGEVVGPKLWKAAERRERSKAPGTGKGHGRSHPRWVRIAAVLDVWLASREP